MAITIVQSATFLGNGASPNAKAFSSNVTAGNWILVGSRSTSSVGAWSCSGTNCGAFTEIGTGQGTPGGNGVRLFYALVSTTGTCTVTLTVAGSNFRGEMMEVSGLASSSPLDQTTKASGTSATPSSGSVTTTQADELLFGVVGTDGGNTFAAGSGYTLREANLDVALQIEYQIVAATGAYAATMSITSAGWSATIATFKGAAAAAVADDDAGWIPQRAPQDLSVVSVW
jgi:hypothetical protein